MLTKLISAVGRFHCDEDGLEAIQVVMIVAIAAVILIGMMKFGNAIFGWANSVFGDLQQADIDANEFADTVPSAPSPAPAGN